LSNDVLKPSNYKDNKEADNWDTQAVKKGKMVFYREELNKQLDYKRRIIDRKRNLDNISTTEYINNSVVKDNDNESVVNRGAKSKICVIQLASRNSEMHSKKQEINARRTSDNISRKSNVSRLKEELLNNELETHLKKNKYQKYLMDSLKKQVDDKREEKLSKAGSIHASKRTTSVTRGSVKKV
jgi:hypothetical protein